MDQPCFLIYGLIDPRSGELRYVGKSCRGLARPRQHATPCRLSKDRTHKANWIRQLQAEGLSYEVEVLEQHEQAETLAEAEQFFIAYFRFVGCHLTNQTIGGDGSRGFRHTAEFRAAIALIHRGSHRSQETRQLMSERQRGNKKCLGHKHSDSSRALMSKKRRERLASPVVSAETRAKLSAVLTGRKGQKRTPTERARLARAHGARPFVDETGVRHESPSEAAALLGLWPQNINAVLRGRLKSTGGHTFRYVE